MRPLVAAAALLTAAIALVVTLLPSPSAFLAVAFSAVGFVAFKRSGLFAAAAYMAAFISLAFTNAALFSPLAELAAFLSLYGNRIDQLKARLVARGYDADEVARTFAEAELTVSLWSAAALLSSYALFYALLGLPRLPPSIALALSTSSLAVILILLLRYRRR